MLTGADQSSAGVVRVEDDVVLVREHQAVPEDARVPVHDHGGRLPGVCHTQPSLAVDSARHSKPAEGGIEQ